MQHWETRLGGGHLRSVGNAQAPRPWDVWCHDVLPVLGAHSLLISGPLPPSGESPIPSQCPGVSAEWYVCPLGHTLRGLLWKRRVCCLFCLPAGI